MTKWQRPKQGQNVKYLTIREQNDKDLINTRIKSKRPKQYKNKNINDKDLDNTRTK